MTQWWNEQTANQKLLDLNRGLRDAEVLFQEKILHLRQRVEFLETENAMLEADNAKLTAGLHYNPNDAW